MLFKYDDWENKLTIEYFDDCYDDYKHTYMLNMKSDRERLKSNLPELIKMLNGYSVYFMEKKSTVTEDCLDEKKLTLKIKELTGD